MASAAPLRLLERFEENIGRGVIHPVGLMDDADLVVAGRGGHGDFADKLTHGALVGGGRAGFDLTCFAGGAEVEAIGMVVGGEPGCDRTRSRIEQPIGNGMSDGSERFILVTGDQQAVRETVADDGLLDDRNGGRADEGIRPSERGRSRHGQKERRRR